MAHADDAKLYTQWIDLMGWMRDYAAQKSLRFDKESDFTQYIYRMERDYALPTTIQAVSLGLIDGTPIIVASVSPLHEPLKSIHVRLMGAHQEWHLHAGDQGLLEGKRAFTQARLNTILDRVFAIKAAS
jgi:NADH-quinone oxidoreductase chain 15